jgi:hypothetical protein
MIYLVLQDRRWETDDANDILCCFNFEGLSYPYRCDKVAGLLSGGSAQTTFCLPTLCGRYLE